jgi:hypothetical protein
LDIWEPRPTKLSSLQAGPLESIIAQYARKFGPGCEVLDG